MPNLLKECKVCSVLRDSETELHNNGAKYVDHSHKTGQIRGLLCAKCNSALGLFNEDTETIQRAIDFLKSKK